MENLLFKVVPAVLILGGLGPTFILFVRERTNAIVERFGKFHVIKRPGLRFRIPIIDKVHRVNLRIQQLDVSVESKTEDNVFVHVKVSVQYKIIGEKVYDAMYKLDDAEEQMQSYIFDTIRAKVPTMKIDDVFAKKEELATAVKTSLKDTMDDFGYDIVQSLVTDIDPNEGVKQAMNRINETERMKVAAENEGEAAKIRAVKEAEGEKEAKKLSGEGIAEQRKAIADGFKKSIDTMKEGVDGEIDAAGIMEVLLMVQHFDTQKDIATASYTNTIFADSSPGGMGAARRQIMQGMMASNVAGQRTRAPSGQDTEARAPAGQSF